MKKPKWIGEETPEILEILAGRSWEDLDLYDDELWRRIAEAVARQPASFRDRGGTVEGTRRVVDAYRRRRLWEARRRVAKDAGADWSGLENEPPEVLTVSRHAPDAFGSVRPPLSPVIPARSDWRVKECNRAIAELRRNGFAPTDTAIATGSGIKRDTVASYRRKGWLALG